MANAAGRGIASAHTSAWRHRRAGGGHRSLIRFAMRPSPPGVARMWREAEAPPIPTATEARSGHPRSARPASPRPAPGG